MTARRNRFSKVITAMGLSVALVLLPTVAYAEGSWGSYITQAQPGFKSRQWPDKNLDGTSTSVTLSNCKANYGGSAAGTLRITSIKLGLYTPSGLVSTRTLPGCGTFAWGDLPAGTYLFRLESINGQTGRVFLNAGSVSVKY